MPFCSQCGTAIPVSAAFCSSCGAAAPSSVAADDLPEHTRRKGRAGQILVGCGLTVIGLLVLSTVCIVLLANKGEETAETSADYFYSRLEAGAECPELYEIRDLLDPKSEYIPAMNEKLRLIGCPSSFATRTRDLPIPPSLTMRPPTSTPPTTSAPQPMPALSPEETFTVREYRIYRMVLDTPLSVPEDEAFRRASAKHGATNC